MHVIGTAGHVDHGKSTLVQAITGIDPDRLKEEKEREMTIDLGYAWLTLPSGETISVVDVPGHEDFIRNMLAGVGGIDAAILVVAADDGVMPQTREHVAILDMLKVDTGLVALTKIDLAESDWIDLVTEELRDLLQTTSLKQYRILPVSARTRQGLPEFVAALSDLLAVTPSRLDVGRPRLLVDRVFTVAGFGTVVTGTLIDGRLRIGDEVEVLPSGLRARIRGLQTHRSKVEIAVPGSRVAANLTGLSVEQLSRGDVVTIPGWLRPTPLIDVRITLLADAPRPLKHNQEVDFFTGATELTARARILGVPEIAPGQDGWAQLRFDRPAPIARNDRFILRQPSPGLTLGGGVVIEPYPQRRHRRFRPEVVERLEALAHGTPAEVLLQTLRRNEPATAKELLSRATLPQQVGTDALGELLESQQIVVLSAADHTWDSRTLQNSMHALISATGWAGWLDQLVAVVAGYHEQYPLRSGMPREELKSRLRLETRLYNEMVELAARAGRVMTSDSSVRLPSHSVTFSVVQQAQAETVLAAFGKQPFTPPTLDEAHLLASVELVAALAEQGKLVKISDEIYLLASAYEQMVAWVRAQGKSGGSINVASLRDAFSTSRKYALPFLEHLDDRRITRRVGDERVLR
jgi:selenocysteine-specific elongation factor